MREGLIGRVWGWAEKHPHAYLAAALLLETFAGYAVCRGRVLEVPLVQFELGARELVATGRIHSTFLPVGYPVLLGWAEMVGARVPWLGENGAVLAMQVAVMVGLVCLAREVLRHFGSPRFATTSALLVGLDPQMMTFVKSVTDTNLTVVALYALAATLLRLRARRDAWTAMLVGLALEGAVQLRPNLLLMVLLLPWALRGERFRVIVTQAVIALGTAGLVYAAFATGVHGTPFFPHNGPYNLYAGSNEYTAEALREFRNAENSIPPAMRDRGLVVQLDWTRQPDDPGRADPRDQRYIPFFREQSRAFLLARPGMVLKLSWLRLRTLFYDNFSNLEHRRPAFFAVTLVVKVVCLGIVPLWLLLVLAEGVRRRAGVSGLFVEMALLYLLPFLATNADPRFRIPLEALLLLDILRMLHAWLDPPRRETERGVMAQRVTGR